MTFSLRNLSSLYDWSYDLLRILIERIRADVLLVRPHDGAVLRARLLEIADVLQLLEHAEGKQMRTIRDSYLAIRESDLQLVALSAQRL